MPPSNARWRRRTPATKSTQKSEATYTSAVPKSGSTNTSPAGSAT